MGVSEGVNLFGASCHLGNSMDPDQIKEIAEVALSVGLNTVERVESLEEMLAHNRERTRRYIREEEAACSEPRVTVAQDGTAYSYVVVRGEYVRITQCRTQVDELEIVGEVEELPVVELAVDACARLDSVREVVCPPQIEKIGSCAFRLCGKLERLVLPRNVDVFESSWVRGCSRLSELVLPGMLQNITQDVFAEGDIRTLVIGPAAREFAPGMFAKGNLECLCIDQNNPYITTDGDAIFAHEGKCLRVLARARERYAVPAGCEVIERKAFANRDDLVSVELPDTITTIEPYAFSYSGLMRFDAPPALRSIGDHAFFRCRRLAEVTLNEGLVSIGDAAFTGTALESLRAPATLEVLGHHIATDTRLTFSGADAGFTIAPGGILELDREGGLYRNTAHGLHFVRLVENDADEYAIRPGTVEIEPEACARHASLRKVTLPEGLLRIGDAAFRDCRDLAIADFPSTLLEVGDEAFLDTSLARVFIPAGLVRLGSTALVTHGAHNGDGAPSLTSIDVDPANERFYCVPGLLVERHDGGGSHAVVYADGTESVRIPDDVTVIDSYAFGGARHLRELFLSDRIRKIGMRGLSIDCFVEHIHVDLVDPCEGHGSFDFYFPDTPRSVHEIQLAFNLSSAIDLARIFKHYDSAIANMHEFDQQASGADAFDVYGQAKLAIDRLSDPVLMSSTNKIMLTQVLSKKLDEVCEAIARHDDRKAIDDLLDLGILNTDNLLDIIDHVAKLQDAAMTGYLLEIKRRLFQRDAMDFDL